jgi:UDPglucose--hexose-1-phosphate uridylyltransferase
VYRRDPITGHARLVAPGRAARLHEQERGCPFCAGHEHDTPDETARRARRDTTPTDADWSARAFPNRFPLTEPHELVVPTPEHVTRWRDVPLPQLQDALSLIAERRAALREPGRYVHTFINDGPQAGASLSHVHAQLAVLERGPHTDQLVAGVCDEGACELCALLDDDSLRIERGHHHALLAHPVPRLGGGLLLVPLEHRTMLDDARIPEFAELLHRAWMALDPALDANLWLVADEERGAHWYVELQPRSSNLAGLELATGLNVSAADPQATAESARERLAMRR